VIICEVRIYYIWHLAVPLYLLHSIERLLSQENEMRRISTSGIKSDIKSSATPNSYEGADIFATPFGALFDRYRPNGLGIVYDSLYVLWNSQTRS